MPRLQENVAIRPPRRRLQELERAPDFVAYVDRIWMLVEDDARTAVIRERV